MQFKEIKKKFNPWLSTEKTNTSTQKQHKIYINMLCVRIFEVECQKNQLKHRKIIKMEKCYFKK